jgi:hypothetical protein
MWQLYDDSQPGLRTKMSRREHWIRTAATIAVFALLVAVGYFAKDYLKLLGPPERCWEIKEIDGHLYKMNPCIGRFILLGDAPTTATGR